MNQFVLGVDGGGTKTDYLLFDTQGNKVAHLRGGATNHECLAGSMAELESLLNGLIPAFLLENGLKPEDLAGSVFGMAGVDVPSQQAKLESIFHCMGFREIRVMNDSFIGIKAGSPKGYGVCVVNGTGNTVGGIDRHGNFLQVAGTGYISGEDGGAGRIAERALRAVYEEFFCLGAPTAMTTPMMSLLGISDPVHFMEAVYDKYRTGQMTARDVLEVLFRAANNGDEVAVSILKAIGGQIARCVAGCVKRLDFADELDVVLVGSVTLKASCPILRDALMSETVRLTGKSVNFIPLAVPVAVGAVLWAIELALGQPAAKDVMDRAVREVSLLV